MTLPPWRYTVLEVIALTGLPEPVPGAFAHGFLLAIALILPLGPQNTFVLTQASSLPRFRDAAAVALTAALCDTFLIAIAVAGLSVIVIALPWFRSAMGLIGALFMLWIAVCTWQAHPGAQAPEEGATATAARVGPAWTRARRIRHSVTVSLLNPHAILDTVLVIGGASVLYHDAWARMAYAVAAIAASWLWFGGLLLAGHTFHHVLGRGSSRARLVSQVSAVLMGILAIRLLVSVL